VLDRPQGTKFTLREMELLGLFANQAAIALDLLSSARQARAVLAGEADDLGVVARLAATVGALEGTRRDDALRLLGELERLL
jgi:GAF domain-containing protein